jgi:release factor glutamine methyltransferase
VLIPRPETELLLDLMRERFKSNAALSVLDLGTGSGALAVSCAKLFPCARVVAVDVSQKAIQIARHNAGAHDVLGQTAFVRGDLVSALRLSSFDVVLANLPYVPLSTRAALSPEVLEYEPELALFSGQDGMDCYRSLARGVSGRMKSGAMLLCEIDGSQGAAMSDLFSPLAQSVRIVKDYAGLDRVAIVVF